MKLLNSLEEMKSRNFICDFTIKVGSKRFPVHRTVLAGCSKYFEGLFSSEMKEVHDNMIDMKGVTEEAIEKCINFMYSATVNLKLKSIRDVLYASHLLQLDGLSKLGLSFLANNLRPENCLEVISLADTYGDSDLMMKGQAKVVSNFSAVVSSSDFCSMSKLDLLGYIPKVGYNETSWKAVTVWSRGHGNDFVHICKDISFQMYPFDFLLNEMLKDSLVQKHDAVKTQIIDALFADSGNLKKNLDSTNWVELRKLTKTRETEKKIEDIMLAYMKNNFEKLIIQSNFVKIEKSDFLVLIQSPKTKVPSEDMKWVAIMKWINFDLKKRKKHFQELFKSLKLDQFSLEYLRDTIQTEPLVTESHKCSNLLVETLFSKASQLSEENKRLKRAASVQDDEEGAVGYASRRPPSDSYPAGNDKDTVDIPLKGHSMTSKTIQSSLPGYHGWRTIVINYSFRAGELQGLKYDAEQFQAYLPENLYLCNLLRKAFMAGYTFKLQKIPCMAGRGRIIWGDIPHKMNQMGGKQNDGYPDKEYENELEKALEAHGVIEN